VLPFEVPDGLGSSALELTSLRMEMRYYSVFPLEAENTSLTK